MHMYEYSYAVVKHVIQFYGTYTISDNGVKRKTCTIIGFAQNLRKSL